jgi:CBS domain-containing protein
MATTLAKSLRADHIGQLKLRDVCAARPSEPIEQVVRRMAERRTGCVLVIESEQPGNGSGANGGGGKIAGIFTERDFINRVVAQGLDVSLPVERVMTRDATTIGRHDSVHKAVELMGDRGYRHLPVLGENDQPIGVLSVKDIVHYLVEYFPAKVYNLPPTPDHTQPAREGA